MTAALHAFPSAEWVAAYGAAKQAAPELGAPLDAWAPALGAATLAILLLAYVAARRLPRAA